MGMFDAVCPIFTLSELKLLINSEMAKRWAQKRKKRKSGKSKIWIICTI